MSVFFRSLIILLSTLRIMIQFGVHVYVWYEVKVHFFPNVHPKLFLLIDGRLIRIFQFPSVNSCVFAKYFIFFPLFRDSAQCAQWGEGLSRKRERES